MKTKAFVSYLNLIPVYQYDIELADVMAAGHVGNNISVGRHPRLAKLKITTAGEARLFNHLKSTVYGALVKRIYEMMMDYFKAIVNCLVCNGISVDKILGSENHMISEREILSEMNWESVCRKISSNIVRAIEEKRDAGKLIKTIATRLNLNIPKKLVDDAKPYIEVRHLLVHNSGLADKLFMSKYAKIVNVDRDGYIVADYRLVQAAIQANRLLVEQYDKELVGKGLIPAAYLQR